MPHDDTQQSANNAIALPIAAELQDHLRATGNDLERLQGLLDQASETLNGCFYSATGELNHLLRDAALQPQLENGRLHAAMQTLSEAIVTLQFQDIANQLLDHTRARLRACCDNLARAAMGDDDGLAVVESGPQRPNPVTQSEMDAGSVELF